MVSAVCKLYRPGSHRLPHPVRLVISPRPAKIVTAVVLWIVVIFTSKLSLALWFDRALVMALDSDGGVVSGSVVSGSAEGAEGTGDSKRANPRRVFWRDDMTIAFLELLQEARVSGKLESSKKAYIIPMLLDIMTALASRFPHADWTLGAPRGLVSATQNEGANLHTKARLNATNTR